MTIDLIDAVARTGANIVTMLSNEQTAPIAGKLLESLTRHVDIEERRTQAARKAAEARLRTEGPVLWKMWHERALEGDPKDVEAERKWLNYFAGLLPCSDCKTHFLTMIRHLFANGFESYFAKTVEAHNIVNDRIGKPKLTVEQAREIYAGALTQSAA